MTARYPNQQLNEEPQSGGFLRKLGVIFGTLGILLAFVIIIAALGQLRPKQEDKETITKAPAAFIQVAKYEDVSLSVYAQGEVRPRTEINLTAQVGGKITQVSESFANGGRIAKGDILVRIEDADYRVAQAQAMARLAQSEQALELAQAEADLALKDFEELGGLESGEQPSALTLRKPQLAQAKANFEAAKADLDNAKLNLSRTVIRAPFTGRIRTKMVDVGQFIGPSTPVAQIFATDIAEIRLPMTDEDLARLDLTAAFNSKSGATGPKVTLYATVAGRAHTWYGHIARTDAAYDPSTRQISAIAEVIDPYGKGADNGFPLAIGLFVSAEIEGRDLTKAIIVPRVALSGQSTVFTVDEANIVREQPVVVAATTAKGVIITSGVEEGQRVVVSRLAAAGPGEEVTPIIPGQDSTPDQEMPNSEEKATSASETTGEVSSNTTTSAPGAN